ncbi:hypothetical protein D9757_005528 [Collybiopsis confluens]|uniref:Oxidation resistance protein 1 n=1 Tax=Collybiopsis confluens TaxID=2823264 RepID=A0A8H5HLQ5_9AGAR|nr:hypothetical protein D9757_005528 [Collybiopsis confluens]
MDSFPPLIPVPAPKSRSGAQFEDKFATLFSPPTPRASPDLPADSIFKSPTRPIAQYQAPNSPDSEFGSFISVPPTEDPLAFATFPDDNPNVAKPSPFNPQHAKNVSLSFFGEFAHEAKTAHERNKRDVMDELLSQDLNWSQQPSSSGDERKTDVNSESLLDLDLDFFTPQKLDTPPESTDYVSHPHTSAQAKASSSPKLTTRKSTLSLAEPAPPVASTSLAFAPNEISPEAEVLSTSLGRSPPSSYQTLSSISSRWMSSLLKSSGAAQESLLSNENTDHHTATHPRFQSSSDSHTRQPRHQTFPFPAAASFSSSISSSLPSSTTIPTGQHPSPFAPHVFVPPSGAPGFLPDGYDWDRGYSQDLDRELAAENELTETTFKAVAKPTRELHGSMNIPKSTFASQNQPHSRSQTPSPSLGIGGLIEKKTGNLELKGRREMTVAVLTVELAETIRAQLPALARLHRSWNLLYSLDQHGISLHTLYDKCENQPYLRTSSTFTTKVGALVVMKDSGDAIFGAYMGDGVRRSRGKGYYGSGESFLWRYVNGNFQVFKWTGKNDYVALCEAEYLSFGGGDGAYGLYLDESLFDGSSAHCPTFDNEPLCTAGEKRGRAVSFECVGLEVWGVGP